jgi:hypothetical protein
VHPLTAGAGRAERRVKPRIDVPFPVTVYGVDAKGEAFKVQTVLDNISAGGLYMRLWPRIEPGATLFIISRFSTSPETEGPAPRVALYGAVLRAEFKCGCTCGVAVAFSHHQFL